MIPWREANRFVIPRSEATWESRVGSCSPYRPSLKQRAPITSVAAVTAQPLAALPPYGCGVPLAGSDRLVQSHSTAGGHWCTAALPDVSLRGAKRRGALSAKREEVPLGCNLAVPSRITGYSRRNRNCLPEIATAPLGPRNDKLGGIAPNNLCRNYCQPVRRSLSAATDAIGAHHFNDSLYELQLPSRDCTPRALPRASRSGRHGRRAPSQWQIREQLP